MHNMYTTGTRFNYLTRLHSLALSSNPTSVSGVSLVSGNAAMAKFIIEGKGYLSSYGVGTGVNKVSIQESGQWEKEARQQYYRLSGDGAALTVQVL